MRVPRRILLALAVALGLSGLFASRGEGSAAPIEMTWSLFGRADAVTFEPGLSPAGAPAGFEIVSFDAVGLGAGLSTYTYGGADLPAAAGGPRPALITCEATATGSELHLEVTGAYPYAGCVFFVGATNTGEEAAGFELGPLSEDADVTCNVAGCMASDVEMLAGAAGDDPLSGCAVTGQVTALDGALYALAPGGQVVCPVFVIVLQPAEENAVYVVEILPPAPQPAPEAEVVLDDPPPGFSDSPSRLAPTATPTAEVPSATPPPPSPTAGVAGERTPGATPIAPATGEAVVVRDGGVEGAPAAGLLLLAGAALFVVAAWPGLPRLGR